jgi:hypothetical protein
MRILIAVLMASALGCGTKETPVQPADASVDTPEDSTPETAPLDVPADVAPKSCKRAIDCGDVSLFVCDPATQQCRAADCDAMTECKAGSSCLKQAEKVTVGICQRSCRALGTSTGCDPSETCVGIPFADRAVCQKRGTAALGAVCEITAVDTGCAEGVCRASTAGATSGTCVAICDPFTSKSACPTGKICTINWDCRTDASIADPATINGICATGGVPCAVVDGAQQGHCLLQYSASICRRGCRVGVECPAGFGCATAGAPGIGNGLGLCFPIESTCQDGGAGSCAECRATETAIGGCCATEAAACTSPECKTLVDCAMACKRDAPCVNACALAAPSEVKVASPLFVCLSGYGGSTGAACGDVCLGPNVCGDFDGPDTPSTCTACMDGSPDCRKNHCFNGFYCNRTTNKCAAPSKLPPCDGSDAGTDGG